MKRLYFFSMYIIFIAIYTKEICPFWSDIINLFITVGIILLLTSSLAMTKGFQLYVSIISLAVGHYILWKYNLGMDIWFNSITKGIGMPVLFVVIPLISFPVKYGNYLESVESFVAVNKKKPVLLFAFLAVMHLALSIALSIGSMPTMQKLLAKINLPKRVLSLLYTAGYSFYMVFSPYDAVVNMVLIFTALKFSDYFTNGLLMGTVIIIVASLILKKDKKLLENLTACLSEVQDQGNSRKIYELLLHILMLIIFACLGVNFIHFSNPTYAIALIVIIYATFWMAQIKAMPELFREIKSYSKNLLGYKSFLPFLMVTSFLGAMVSYTPLKENIGKILLVMDSLPVYFVIQLLMILTTLLSLCGVHMMITITTLAITISPQFLGLTANAYALTLLSCWFLAMSISPFVPFSVVVAETIGDKPYNVSFKYNLKFFFIMIFLAPVIILIANGINF